MSSPVACVVVCVCCFVACVLVASGWCTHVTYILPVTNTDVSSPKWKKEDGKFVWIKADGQPMWKKTDGQFICKKNAAVTEGGSGQRKWSHTQTHDGSPVDASASHAISQEVIDQNPITSVVTAVDSEHDGTGARERKGSAAVGMIHVVTDEPVRSGVVHTEQGLGSNREATEHVHMHDCRNVIDLIDLVTRGRLQATIDAQRAGVVGMSGNGGGGASMSSAALIIFACLGVTYTLIFTFCVVMVGLGKLPVVQFFASGLWLLGLAGPSGIMRAGLLHTLKPQGEALGAGRARAGSGMHRASQRLIKLNSLAQGSFAVFIVSLALCTAWFGIYYGASGGALNMWPILPRKPTRGFATYIGVALPLVALLELNILWIGFTRNKKIAQLFGKMGFTSSSQAFTSSPARSSAYFFAQRASLLPTKLYGRD